MCESVFHSSSTEADRHTVRQHRDPSSEPLSFVAARPTYIGRWKFRLKCIQLRKALRSLLSQITKLIWLPWTEVFASIMWLCNCALWPSKRAFITAIAQEKTYLFRIAHTLRWWCEMNTKFICFFLMKYHPSKPSVDYCTSIVYRLYLLQLYLSIQIISVYKVLRVYFSYFSPVSSLG